jgi:hypothetical protein
MLLAPLSNLEFPSWRAPGFDPTHPASNDGGSGASFIPASGGVYINLRTGGATAKSSTQTYGLGIAGPYVQSNTSGAYGTFANAFPTTPGAITMGAVITPAASVAGGCLFATTATSGSGLQMTMRSLVLGYRNSTLYSSSLAAMSIGTPYFVALSCNGTTTYFVQANLATGQVLTASIASGVSQGSTSTWDLGGQTGGGVEAGCDIHAMMAGFVALSPAQLRAWAADPWAFWYPDDDLDTRLVGLSSRALSFAGLSPSMFRALSAVSGAQTMTALGGAQAAAPAASRQAAAVATRSRAAAAARGAPGSGAFFAATGAARAVVRARAAASLAAALSGQSAGAAKARSSPALGAFLETRARGAAAVKGVFSAGTGLYAASGMARALLQARGAIIATASFIINPNLILKAPATIRSLAAPATMRSLKAISTIRNLKAP